MWSALLIVHEGGHAIGALSQGFRVTRISVGVGPALWRGQSGETRLALRLVPLAGVTTLDATRSRDTMTRAHARDPWRTWSRELVTLASGVLATLALAVAAAVVVILGERARGSRWRWGRYLVADAVILSVFNLLPIPPLDGGRAVLGAFGAWRGAPLAGVALWWVQLGGLAIAMLPMMVWTRWTSRIDAAALRWVAPRSSA